MINNGLNSMNGAKAILLGALLGGMMSVDMGGPVNKAAYVFGTASIAAGNYNIMAAVMVVVWFHRLQRTCNHVL